MNKFAVILIGFFLTGAAVDDARQANQAYREGRYAEAEELYRKAIDADPENDRLYFNLGNTLAQQDKWDEAIQVFEQFKAMTDDPQQRALADYNIGNIFVENEEWGRAINQYKAALRYRSADEDSKYNYELALQKQRERESEQQNQQNQQDQNQNQDQQQPSPNSNQQQQQMSEDQQQQDGTGNEETPPQQAQADQMSREQAENILQALEQQERELLRDFKKVESESISARNEKDW